MKEKSFKILAGLFLAGLIAVAVVGCFAQNVYTTGQLEELAQKSPDEINKRLKGKVITIKDFEVKGLMADHFLASVSHKDSMTWLYDVSDGIKHELVCILIWKLGDVENADVGDKITVKVKLDQIMQDKNTDLYQLVFRSIES
jgi:hypothetical protein